MNISHESGFYFVFLAKKRKCVIILNIVFITKKKLIRTIYFYIGRGGLYDKIRKYLNK